MSNLIKLSILLGYAAINVSALLQELAGPYELTFRHLGDCEKKGKVNVFHNMKFGKLNRTHFAYTGLFDMGVELNDSVKMRMVAANKGPNGRYNTVLDVQYKICELFRAFGMDIAQSIFDHCNRTFECPTKRFTCEMNNWVLTYNIQNVPAFPYGDYRLDLSVIKIHQSDRKELISCTRFYGLVSPKISKSQARTNV